MLAIWIILTFCTPLCVFTLGIRWLAHSRRNPAWLLIVPLVASLTAVPFAVMLPPVMPEPVLPRVLVQKCHWEVRP